MIELYSSQKADSLGAYTVLGEPCALYVGSYECVLTWVACRKCVVSLPDRELPEFNGPLLDNLNQQAKFQSSNITLCSYSCMS